MTIIRAQNEFARKQYEDALRLPRNILRHENVFLQVAQGTIEKPTAMLDLKNIKSKLRPQIRRIDNKLFVHLKNENGLRWSLAALVELSKTQGTIEVAIPFNLPKGYPYISPFRVTIRRHMTKSNIRLTLEKYHEAGKQKIDERGRPHPYRGDTLQKQGNKPVNRPR